jgi:DNA-binding winged helix-turn-helix (wHTH) protein
MARFGSFELDSVRRQLLRNGEVVHLTPKAFDLLTVLVDAAPGVVTKAQIHERLWPRTFVSDATLIGLVKELRRALDDRDRDAPVIRTAHRVGYAFCLEIENRGAKPPPVCGWLIAGERRIPLASGENVVGRDPACAVWLDHATVSRRHAKIVASDEGVVLEDLGSKNGTEVGQTALGESVALRDGDSVRFGKVTVTFRASNVAAPTAELSRATGMQPPR